MPGKPLKKTSDKKADPFLQKGANAEKTMAMKATSKNSSELRDKTMIITNAHVSYLYNG